jgi:iron complex outermembrane recepter protein
MFALIFRASAGVCLLSALAAPVFAQSASTADASASTSSEGLLEEVTVTAQFRAQPLQETPIAITAMTADALEARSQQTVIDVGAFAPNVNLTSATSLNGNAVSAFIRGVGQSDASFALEPGVGMYIDDVYYGTTFGAVFDLTDLDRVEVLRGPQGTLAGKNSVGGAVKMFTKKPDGEGGGFIEATYGSFSRTDIRASGEFKLADGMFARVSGVSKRSDGYFTLLDFGCANPGQGIAPSPSVGLDCKIGEEGGLDVQALRLALRYAPEGSPLEINLSGDVATDRSQSVATKLIYADNQRTRSYDPANPLAGVPLDSRFITGPESYSAYTTYRTGGNYTTVFGFPRQVAPGAFEAGPIAHADSHGFAATVDYQFSDSLSLKSITAYRKAEGLGGIDVDGSPLDVLLQTIQQNHKQFTQELRLSTRVGELVDLTVGGFYYDADDLLRMRNEIPDVIFDFLSNDPVSNKSKSVFAHSEFHLTEQLDLIGGLRYTDDEKTYTFSRRNIDGTIPSGIPPTTNFLLFGLDGAVGTYSDSHMDYRLGVNYRWNNDVMTYAQVSTGFKGGGVNPRPYVPQQILPFGPEELTTYEIGFKTDLLNRILRVNGAVFFNDYSDLQLALFVCPESPGLACSRPANAGNAEVKGAELEITAQPVTGLTVDATVGYLDFEYTDVNPATGVTLDMQAPFTNEWQGSAGVQYATKLGSAGTLTPRLDWTYQSSFFFNAVNTPLSRVAGRSLLNARLNYETNDGNWVASAAVTNLTDKFYYTSTNENVVNYQIATAAVGRPREWSIALKRRF